MVARFSPFVTASCLLPHIETSLWCSSFYRPRKDGELSQLRRGLEHGTLRSPCERAADCATPPPCCTCYSSVIWVDPYTVAHAGYPFKGGIVLMKCMNAALASAAFMHHADPTGLIHFRRVGMTHQCSASELLASAALAHHDDK